MSYATEEMVADEFGGWPKLNDALDDRGEGKVEPGLLDRLLASASVAVDGFVQGRYVTPLSPVPSIAVEATLIFTIEKIYNRRKQGPDERNPYEERATELRKRLKRISDREESLDAAEKPAFEPGAVFTDRSKLQGSSLG